MPRYKYECVDCGFVKTYHHGINEVIKVCEKCTQKTMEKKLNNIFSIKNKKKTSKDSQIGEITKQHIEDNRKILQDQKKEAKKKTYEPS